MRSPALAQADVVVYDALVDQRVLALARPGAALEFAGKRGGKPSPSRPTSRQRLIALARAGRRVLRLKGGDPFVFGRGGEEALALAEAGIPFRVIPGVTAGPRGAGGGVHPGDDARQQSRGHPRDRPRAATRSRMRLGGARAHRPADHPLHGDARISSGSPAR